MPLALDDFDSNCIGVSVIDRVAMKCKKYLGQHARGGLHFGGEVKPQLRASGGR